MKYAVDELDVVSKGPIDISGSPTYATLIVTKASQKPIFAVYTSDSTIADQLTQSLGLALQKSLVVDIP